MRECEKHNTNLGKNTDTFSINRAQFSILKYMQCCFFCAVHFCADSLVAYLPKI